MESEGYLWRPPGKMAWHFRRTLTGRTYPEGSEFVKIEIVTEPEPIPKQ